MRSQVNCCTLVAPCVLACRAISIYRLSRKEYKLLAHFYNGVSVSGRILERGIKNWPISRIGYQF